MATRHKRQKHQRAEAEMRQSRDACRRRSINAPQTHTRDAAETYTTEKHTAETHAVQHKRRAKDEYTFGIRNFRVDMV
ncbi:APC membrane recruitment protein 1 [Sesbania bispinosa]|nr:APC membrane recruitment protein 1 [Sesbania bispinosa]